MNHRRRLGPSALAPFVCAVLTAACGDYASKDAMMTDSVTGQQPTDTPGPGATTPEPTQGPTDPGPPSTPEPAMVTEPEPTMPAVTEPAPDPTMPPGPDPMGTASSGGAPNMPEPAGGAAGMPVDPGPVEVPEASCEPVVACGGDVVGTWVAGSSCLPVSGNVDMTGFGLGCMDSPVTGALEVTGTWTFNADGTMTDETTTTGTEDIALLAACLDVSGTITACDRVSAPLASLGFADIECTDDATTGGCNCPATVDQSSGAALISYDAIDSGDYTAADNVLTITDGRNETQYAYCVEGDILTMTPQSATPTGPVGGTMVFVRQ